MDVLFLTAALMVLPSQSLDIMRVEEDWELVLNTPGPPIHSPQFHTHMSPFVNDSMFAQFTWNYRDQPEMAAGGLQVQAWNGESLLAKKTLGAGLMDENDDTASWTQRFSTTGSKVTIAVVDGNSTSWGPFGGMASTIVGHVALPNLNQYDPAASVENSCITLGRNRVQLLRLMEVRYYDAGGNLINTDTTSRVVYSQP